MAEYAAVPRIIPGGTVLCIGSGPSLTREDVEACRGKVDGAIAINTSYLMAPWADVLYACDHKWWKNNPRAAEHSGLKFALKVGKNFYPSGVIALESDGTEGLDLRPTHVRTGKNSGYQAINVAVHMGAARVILLGYDMGLGPRGRTHWHEPHPNMMNSPYGQFKTCFQTLVEPLKSHGVEVLNCSRRTTLNAFPRVSLEAALSRPMAVAS